MQARPNDAELAAAVREFLETEIVPVLSDPRLKFRALVAMNALGMLEREATIGEDLVRAEYANLAVLLEVREPAPASLDGLKARVNELNAQLAARIRAGNAPTGTFETLKRAAVDKLRVSSPGYLKRYQV